MKILHLGKYYPPHRGGMEHYLADLAREQRRSHCAATVLVHDSKPALRSRAERIDDVPVHRAATLGTLIFAPISLAWPWLLRRLLKQEQPDILHLHLPNTSVFWLLLMPAARKIPWVVHWHADVPVSEHNTGIRLLYRCYAPFERAILRRARAIIATSPPYLRSSAALAEFAPRARAIPLGIDRNRLPTASPDASNAEDRPALRVLFVGRLTYYKGVEYALQALTETTGVELHIVGDGDRRASLESMAAALGISGRTHFHGEVSDADVAGQLQACDCLCLPSIERTEAFGVVLLEAMAAQRALVVSDVPGSGMGWVTGQGEAALLVPPQDATALAEAFTRLRDDPKLRDDLAAAGHARMERYFTIERSSAEINDLYSEFG